MNYEVKKALDEVMDIPPLYRRDWVAAYVRENLPREEAKAILFNKRKETYLQRMIEAGYTSVEEILGMIGPERVREYLISIDRMS